MAKPSKEAKKGASAKTFRKPIPEPKPNGTILAKKGRFNSDVIVDMLHRYGFPFAALNPGASYRGLHDSIVQYGKNVPYMMLCQHEETAVQIAHGYARATGKPMVAIVHNLVGLLHSNLAIYYAYIDRAPVFILGATGPMNETKRRPKIDWTHTANVQGESIRHYTKWDYQPSTVDGIPEAMSRAYSVMMSGPQGPIYMCFDAWLQEEKLEHDVVLPRKDFMEVPTKIAPDPKYLDEAAEMLVRAKKPVLLAEFSGRSDAGYYGLIELAEALQAPVVDLDMRQCFPGTHPLNLSMHDDVFDGADVVCGCDVRDWERPTTHLTSTTRKVERVTAKGAKFIDIGFNEVVISKWSMDYQRFMDADLKITADTDLALPELAKRVKSLMKKNPNLWAAAQKRGAEIARKHKTAREKWMKIGREVGRNDSPMPLPTLAYEVWDKIKHHDWVLTAGTLEDWTRRIWDFDKPYRHAGKSLGTSTQIGTSLGVALAHRQYGRLCVDMQPDGDLMFDAGALWVAAKHNIPMLIVMYNNRAYYNDWEHQIRMARYRGTDEKRAHIGMDMCDPDPDFAGLAKSMGWYAEGPIDTAKDVGPALERAIEKVRNGQPALLDTLTVQRDEYNE
jgi:acetolactate synthase-1/2/3 large subunit